MDCPPFALGKDSDVSEIVMNSAHLGILVGYLFNSQFQRSWHLLQTCSVEDKSHDLPPFAGSAIWLRPAAMPTFLKWTLLKGMGLWAAQRLNFKELAFLL
jgi:hypothetical protein